MLRVAAIGFSYAVTKPGSFRMTFSIRPHELVLALQRIEKVCELEKRVDRLAEQEQFGSTEA